MNTQFLKTILPTAMVFLTITRISWAQSPIYFQSITNLSPAGYWPMHEVEAAAPGDIETNYGTLGLLGTGYYPDYQVNSGAFLHQIPGALANDPDTAVFFTGPAGGGTITNGLVVPHTSPLAALIPPFSVECWFMATNIGAGQGDIMSEGDGTKTQGLRLYYQNTSPSDPVNLLTYDGTASGQLNFTTTSMASNVWHHLVLTCDVNTNMSAWWDGAKVTGPTAFVGKYRPDVHEPFTVGTGLGDARAFHGLIDEVAVYSEVISNINQQYTDGSSGSAGAYFSDVTNDNPVIYLRMDSSAYAAPAVGSWPVLVNYGQINGVATGNGVYTPGTMPGVVVGASYTSFPLGLVGGNVALLGGVSSFADAGYSAAYNPTGTTPFTISAFFRGNPTDTNRVQSIVGHGTNSWQLGLTAGGFIVFNSGTNSTAVVATGTGIGDLASTTAAYDDGTWHQVVAVHNGTTNVLYVDGVANNTNVLLAANNLGDARDVMIGSDPCYTNTPVGLGRQFAGQICEVGFFTNALTTPQVQTLYNNSGLLPMITQQPVSAAVNAAVAFTNTVAISGGSTPLFYQWYTNGVAIGGATNLALILNPVLPGSGSADYYFVVTNNFGAVTSTVVSLTVYSTPAITSQLPVPYTNLFALYSGVSPTFSVAAVGAQIACQWYTNGKAAGGATNLSYTFANVRTALTSYCILTNNYGSVTSFVWSATVLATNGLAPYPLEAMSLNPTAYWRLDDTNLDGVDNGSGDDGYICHDYVDGNDGIYTNVSLGQPGYAPTTDPSETSMLLNYYNTVNCDANSIIAPDFYKPNGSNAEFTIAAWVNPSGQSAANAGIVTKGYFNNEEIDLDCGAPSSSFRFEVRNAAGTAYNANSTYSTANGSLWNQWYHLVGVCDEANGLVSFYINGILATNVSIPAASGIINSSGTPLTIGGRASTATSGVNYQFVGYINDVSTYNYALNSNQVAALFGSSGIAPFFTQEPVSNTNGNQGGTLTVPAMADGSNPLFYRWFDVNANNYIPSQTNATLVISNFTASDSYYLTVSNVFGVVNSTTVYVTLSSGEPSVSTDVQNPFYGVEGRSTGNSVLAYGTAPLSYQWQFYNGTSWVNLTDNGRIVGSQTPNLTINNVYPSDAGNYQAVITNASGSTASSTATLIVAGLPLNFNTNGLYWTANGSARIANGVLSLTDPNNGGGDGSFFFQYPQYIGAFQAAFTYQAGGNMAADGVTFCLQNDPRGAAAEGGSGGSIGVSGITPSAELELDIFNTPKGYAFETNGAVPGIFYTAPGSVQLNSGDPIQITVNYANGQMALTFTDAVANTSYSTTLNVGDLTDILGGDTAYIGFTGSYGGSTSVQTIANFSFVSIASQSIELTGGNNAVVSWPGSILGYVLQQNSDLSTPNWSNVTNSDNVLDGEHQVAMPLSGTNLFYRLMLQQ